jgi:hypothetical protein
LITVGSLILTTVRRFRRLRWTAPLLPSGQREREERRSKSRLVGDAVSTPTNALFVSGACRLARPAMLLHQMYHHLEKRDRPSLHPTAKGRMERLGTGSTRALRGVLRRRRPPPIEPSNLRRGSFLPFNASLRCWVWTRGYVRGLCPQAERAEPSKPTTETLQAFGLEHLILVPRGTGRDTRRQGIFRLWRNMR